MVNMSKNRRTRRDPPAKNYAIRNSQSSRELLQFRLMFTVADNRQIQIRSGLDYLGKGRDV